jgi:hypothetical protein
MGGRPDHAISGSQGNMVPVQIVPWGIDRGPDIMNVAMTEDRDLCNCRRMSEPGSLSTVLPEHFFVLAWHLDI